jgi:hypothetical protein
VIKTSFEPAVEKSKQKRGKDSLVHSFSHPNGVKTVNIEMSDAPKISTSVMVMASSLVLGYGCYIML